MKKLAFLLVFALMSAFVLSNFSTTAGNVSIEEKFSVEEAADEGAMGAYNFDKNHSTIGFRVKHMGLVDVPGYFRDFTGTVNYDPKEATKSTVEFTAKMPTRMKIRGGETKWILREAMKGILPDEILHRPKMGFPVPLGNWLRNQFKSVVDEYVLSGRALSRGIFDAAFVRELVARHNAGEAHTQRIFRLVTFEIWQRQFIDGEISENYQPAANVEEEIYV